jgi:hypothetical protein
MPLKLRASFYSLPMVLVLAIAQACGASGVNESASPKGDGAGDRKRSVAVDAIASQRTPVSSALISPEGLPGIGEALVLEGIVIQRVPSEATVHIKLVLPDGVQLLEGSRDQRLPATDVPRTDSLRFVIRPKNMPTEDAVLIVDVRGDGFGYHAEHRYRFGRHEPVPSAPPRQGPSLQLHGKDLGPSVRVTR